MFSLRTSTGRPGGHGGVGCAGALLFLAMAGCSATRADAPLDQIRDDHPPGATGAPQQADGGLTSIADAALETQSRLDASIGGRRSTDPADPRVADRGRGPAVPGAAADAAAANRTVPDRTDAATTPSSNVDGDASAGDTSQPTEDLLSARDIASALADARCRWLLSCCTAGELLLELGLGVTDQASCVEALTDQLWTTPVGDSARLVQGDPLFELMQAHLEGRIELSADQDALKRCSGALQAEPCAVATPPVVHCQAGSVQQPPTHPCSAENLATPRRGPGEACSTSSSGQCTQGAHCVLGVCQALAVATQPCSSDDDCAERWICDPDTGTCGDGAQAGQACSFRDPTQPLPGTEQDRCARGLVCDEHSLTCTGRTCELGAACDDTSQCPEGTFCRHGFASLGHCSGPRAPGEFCNAASECADGASCQNQRCAHLGAAVGSACALGSLCEAGAFCEFTSEPATCRAGTTLGAPCSSDAQCIGGYCDRAAAVPICAAPREVGASCESDVGCVPGLDCIDGTCRLAAIGEACAWDEDCAAGRCHDGLCAVSAAIGEACSADLLCEAGAFCDLPPGATAGICQLKRTTGESCSADAQCEWRCIDKGGDRYCDGGFSLFCDGE